MNNSKFHYFVKANTEYANGLSVHLNAIIHHQFVHCKGTQKLLDNVYLYLINETQFVNQRNESGIMKPFVSTNTEIAKEFETHRTTIRRVISWLVENNWLTVSKLPHHMQAYSINLKRVNDAIAEFESAL